MTAMNNTIAELTAEVSALRAERDAALALRGSHLEERAAYQVATIEVLKVMSASPGDPQPIFDLITRRALVLCNGMLTGRFVLDEGLVHLRSITGTDDM